MTHPRQSNGCFHTFSTFWMIIFAILLLSLTTFNVYFSNIVGETCGYIHPFIFEVETSFVNDEGLALTTTGYIPSNNNADVAALLEDGMLQSASENELDTFLRIYDERSEIILATNDDRGGSTTSLIENFTVGTTQTVIIEVSTFFDSFEGRYELQVDEFREDEPTPLLSETPVPFEGDTRNAGDVQIDIPIEGIIEQNERIQYRLLAREGIRYRVDLTGVEGLEAPDRSAATWSSCLQFYGFVSDSGYIINRNGFTWFLTSTVANEALDACDTSDGTFRDTLAQCVQSSVSLSATGRVLFFVILAMLVVSLPIFIVDVIETYGEVVWYIFLMLVVVQATTTAMLFLHLGEVSGIDALAEFGYTIFGGITIGATLVFINRVANRARDIADL